MFFLCFSPNYSKFRYSLVWNSIFSHPYSQDIRCLPTLKVKHTFIYQYNAFTCETVIISDAVWETLKSKSGFNFLTITSTDFLVSSKMRSMEATYLVVVRWNTHIIFYHHKYQKHVCFTMNLIHPQKFNYISHNIDVPFTKVLLMAMAIPLRGVQLAEVFGFEIIVEHWFLWHQRFENKL